MIRITESHPDHYIRLEAANDRTAAWWDAFTCLTVVVSEVGIGISGAIGASLLVSVIDRQSNQTFAWAFHADSSATYISEKMPRRAFNKFWRQRLSQSIQVMLRLHAQATKAA